MPTVVDIDVLVPGSLEWPIGDRVDHRLGVLESGVRARLGGSLEGADP